MPDSKLFYTLLKTEDQESEDVMSQDDTAEWVKETLKIPDLIRITIEPYNP